jgi:hypothetical protein
MKAAAIVASLLIHLGGLLAIPTDPATATTEAGGAVAKADTCKCDLEIPAACGQLSQSH